MNTKLLAIIFSTVLSKIQPIKNKMSHTETGYHGLGMAFNFCIS